MNWYDKVSKDISNIPDAAAYYESELIAAKADARVSGNLERAAANMPGIVENRFNQLQEIEAILEYLNIELRRLRSQHFRKYLENYQRALSSRDCEKFVEGEADDNRQIVALTAINRIRFDVDGDEQVTRVATVFARSSFAAQSNLGAVFHPCGNSCLHGTR